MQKEDSDEELIKYTSPLPVRDDLSEDEAD